jgi:hypothetical protein
MIKPPPCFGLLFEVESPECGCCLVNDRCRTAELAPRASNRKVNDLSKMTKSELILGICHRYGLPTEYTDRGGQTWVVTPEDVHKHGDMAHLLTNRSALEALFRGGPDDARDYKKYSR